MNAEKLRKLFAYDPETGIFRRLVSAGGKPVGSIAGTPRTDDGYVIIWIDCQCYRAHRLAWLYMTGSWPPQFIDHANGIKGDNRFANLREANPMQNLRNSKLRRDNKVGLKGVYSVRKKWRARIVINGAHRCLGYFPTAEEAHAAYCRAADENFGEFARTS